MSARSRYGLLAAIAGALATSASCQLLYGLDDFRSGAADGSGSGAGEGGGAGGAGGAGGGAGGSPPCECVLATPAMWQGPYRVHPHPTGETLAACGDGTPVVGELLQDPTAPTCTPCACDVQQACTTPSMTCYKQHGCAGSAAVFSSALASGCELLTDFILSPYRSCRVTSAAAPEGCVPQGGELQPAAWGNGLSLCGAAPDPEGACAEAEVCLTPAPGGGRLCVAFDGNALSCPEGWTDRLTTYLGPGSGALACSACSCGPQTGISCGEALRIHPTPGCPGGDTAPPAGDCVELNDAFASSAELDAPKPGACAPSGGQLQGTFDPGPEFTLCCVPASP